MNDDFVNVSMYLRNNAREFPFRRAVVYPAGRDAAGRTTYAHLTFQQLDRESDCLAHGLQEAGIVQGARTILMVRPSLELFSLTFALFKIGAVPVMVDPGMGVKRMLACLEEGQPEAFIGIPAAHALRVLRPGFFKTVKIPITIGKRWFWGGSTLAQIRKTPWTPFSVARTRKEDTAAILFTTGSTGPAKGAIYTHGIFDAQVSCIRRLFDIGPDEIDLPTFPLFSLFDPALGMTAVIPDMDPTRPAQVNAEKIIQAIEDHGVTNMFASPALLSRVGAYAKSRGIQLPSVRRVVSAGAPASPDNIERFSEILSNDAKIYTPYGATEAMPVLSIESREILSETAELTRQGFGACVGRPVEGVDVRIVEITDDPIAEWSDDLEVGEDEIGEITVKGDVVTPGYFQRPEADALAKMSDGDGIRRRMGDLGWQDQKDRIWFCGRKSHRVITESGLLFTIPCEAIFNQHPGVLRSALVGVGEKTRQAPVICIELKPEARGMSRNQLTRELLELGRQNILTQSIDVVLFHKAFPVDIRHNSKIFREKLAVWAAKQLKKKGLS